MIFGLLTRQALATAGLPDDAAHLQVAKTECNWIIQDLWYSQNGKYRTSPGQLTTVDGADTYILNKYHDEFVKNTMQGPSTRPIHFTYLEPERFFALIRSNSSSGGSPQYYTFGEMVGFDAQLVNASRITAFSSLASKVTGSVNFVSGSDLITSDADLFTLNDVGLRVQKSGDAKSYKIGKFISPRKMQLLEKYRGTTADTAVYAIGDVGIHVNINGFIGGQIDSEDMELDGSNHIQSIKTVNTLVSISKSDKTGGNITVQDDAGNTLGVLAPGDTEIERYTVRLWPEASDAEVIKYRFYMKHPWLWLDTDRLFLREKWHRLVGYRLEKRLRESFEKEVPKGLLLDIAKIEEDFQEEAEDLSHTPLVPDDTAGLMGGQYWYDHLEHPYAQ